MCINNQKSLAEFVHLLYLSLYLCWKNVLSNKNAKCEIAQQKAVLPYKKQAYCLSCFLQKGKKGIIFSRKEEFLMSKKMLIAIAVVIIIALVGGGLYLAYEKRQEVAMEETRKAAEEAAKEKAEETKEVAETPAQEEKKSLSERIEEESKDAPEGSVNDLDEEEKKKLEIYNREFDEIEKVLTEYNRLDNTYDYRTVTLEQLLKAAEYLGNTYGHKEKYEKAMPQRLNEIKNGKLISEFDSIKIRTLIFTDETFEYPTDDYDNLTHAYIELEIRAKQISPEEEYSSSLIKTWMQKIDGQWKVVGEELIKKLE